MPLAGLPDGVAGRNAVPVAGDPPPVPVPRPVAADPVPAGALLDDHFFAGRGWPLVHDRLARLLLDDDDLALLLRGVVLVAARRQRDHHAPPQEGKKNRAEATSHGPSLADRIE